MPLLFRLPSRGRDNLRSDRPRPSSSLTTALESGEGSGDAAEGIDDVRSVGSPIDGMAVESDCILVFAQQVCVFRRAAVVSSVLPLQSCVPERFEARAFAEEQGLQGPEKGREIN